jgi:hypothetical protein
MSGAEQFTAAVPERSDPTDWRGGLERSGARRGRGLTVVGLRDRILYRARAPRERNRRESRWGVMTRGTMGGNGRLGGQLQEIFGMAMYRHERTECQCVDEEANRRFFGWMLACLGASMSICRRTMGSVRQGSSVATEYWERASCLVPVMIASAV